MVVVVVVSPGLLLRSGDFDGDFDGDFLADFGG